VVLKNVVEKKLLSSILPSRGKKKPIGSKQKGGSSTEP
jgi:hypothetical protein